MAGMFDSFENLSDIYIPNNEEVCEPEREVYDNNPLKKLYDSNHKFVGYSWNYGDSVSIPFSIWKVIKVECDAIIYNEHNQKPNCSTIGHFGQKVYNTVDLMCWECRTLDQDTYKWVKLRDFSYPSNGVKPIKIRKIKYSEDSSIEFTMKNFRHEVILHQVVENSDILSIDIDKELSKQLLKGNYFITLTMLNSDSERLDEVLSIVIKEEYNPDDLSEPCVFIKDLESIVSKAVETFIDENPIPIKTDSELMIDSANPIQNSPVAVAINEVNEKINRVESSIEDIKDAVDSFDIELQKTAKEAKENKFSVQKIQNYLYSIDYDKLNYDAGEKYFLEKFNPNFGACSAIRKGNFYGRNYDWYYDDKASFIINRKATQGKYASIGVASAFIKNSIAESGEYNELYEYLPFVTRDGINEKGVVCSINMIPAIDRKSITTGTNPGKPNIPMSCLVRRILDEASSVDDAVYRIKTKYNIIAPNCDDLNAEMHFMIADKNKTVIVEFINNEPIFIYDFVDNKPIITNFYLDNFNIVDGIKQGLTLHAEGLERYDILHSGYDSINSMSDMQNLMKQVFYTNAYNKQLSPFWYSEFYENWGPSYGDFNINSNPLDFKGVIDEFIDANYPGDRHAKTPNIWQTVHSSVYDIENKKLNIIVQENNIVYKFKLSILGESDENQNSMQSISELVIDGKKLIFNQDGSVSWITI